MVGGTEAIPLLFIYKNLKSPLLLLETSFLEECILRHTFFIFEDFPLEREKLNKLMNKETDTTKENHDVGQNLTE
jgi:hypothetical protein